MHDLEDYCFEALKAGALGYVLKTVADRDLVEACRAAMRGESFVYPPTIRSLMRAYVDDPERAGAGPLTIREREVAKLVAEAHATEQIAELLVISPRTVERHRWVPLPMAGATHEIQAGATPEERTEAMAVPPSSGREVGSSYEHDPRNDPSPHVPKPLPDHGRRGGAAIALVVAVLIVIALIVLL